LFRAVSFWAFAEAHNRQLAFPRDCRKDAGWRRKRRKNEIAISDAHAKNLRFSISYTPLHPLRRLDRKYQNRIVRHGPDRRLGYRERLAREVCSIQMQSMRLAAEKSSAAASRSRVFMAR
jgi:hypothetical protein